MNIEARQLLLLLNWMSPAFPVGSFAYSHGLEWAIANGDAATAEDVRQWIADLIERGSGWNDAVIFARCFEDDPRDLNDLALALASSKERYLETTQLGRAFEIAAAVFAPGPHPASPPAPMASPREKADDPYSPSPVRRMGEGARGADEGPLAYPVAAAAACQEMGVAKDQALLAFVQGFAAALTSVAVRLVPLGQTQGLMVLRDLMPVIAATAERASRAMLDDLGSITILSDIAAMKHETLQSRVFRT